MLSGILCFFNIENFQSQIAIWLTLTFTDMRWFLFQMMSGKSNAISLIVLLKDSAVVLNIFLDGKTLRWETSYGNTPKRYILLISYIEEKTYQLVNVHFSATPLKYKYWTQLRHIRERLVKITNVRDTFKHLSN